MLGSIERWPGLRSAACPSDGGSGRTTGLTISESVGGDDRPVGTALGVVDGPVLGIFNVATVPDARRRGVGRAVMLAAMRDGANRGCRLAVLQSSDMGHTVYERLGFRDFGTYELWSHPA